MRTAFFCVILKVELFVILKNEGSVKASTLNQEILRTSG